MHKFICIKTFENQLEAVVNRKSYTLGAPIISDVSQPFKSEYDVFNVSASFDRKHAMFRVAQP